MKVLSQIEVKAVIADIGNKSVAVVELIHQAAFSVLDHAREFGDYRGALDLLNVMRGQRQQALVAWFRHFSSKTMKFKLNGKVWEGSILSEQDGRSNDSFRMTEAEATSYVDFTNEPAPSTLSLEKFLKKIATIAVNSAENEDKSPKVSSEARQAATLMLANFKASQSAALKATA